MAFVKYEVAPPSKADVRVGKLGITISSAALGVEGLASASLVNLYYDADLNAIGISATADSDPSGFALTPRGKSGGRFIAAGKFYSQFGLDAGSLKTSDGKLYNRGNGLVAFGLIGSTASVPVEKKPYTGKPRGRRKKVVEPVTTSEE